MMVIKRGNVLVLHHVEREGKLSGKELSGRNMSKGNVPGSKCPDPL